MPRKKISIRKRVYVDPVYKSKVVAKFISRMMIQGKKSVSSQLFYKTLERIKEKTKQEPIEIFSKALENV